MRKAISIWALLLMQSLVCSVGSQAKSDTPVICAIRWDAWYTNGASDPGHYTALALSKPEWHSRAPLHAHFDASGNIDWAASQESFDAEIKAAHQANLCWAYMAYGANHVIDLNNSMMKGLSFHRRSSFKDEVKYAIMTTAGLLGTQNEYKASVEATVSLFRDSNYQFVSVYGARRPLLFIFYDAFDVVANFDNNLENLKKPIDALRSYSIAQGSGSPYIVIVLSGARRAEEVRNRLGADAISQYIAGHRDGTVQSWAQFEPSIEAEWNNYSLATSAHVIPTIRSGADIRARCQTPPPYDHRFPPKDKCQEYVINPTLDELKAELRNALMWTFKHQAKDPSGLLLVYAWSECDESGNCLMPTYGDPLGKKLRAIHEAVDSFPAR